MDSQPTPNLFSKLLNRIGIGQPSSQSSSPMGNGGKLYDLGQLTRRNRKHNPPALSGDAAVTGSADLMNRRARHLYNNNTQAKRPIDLYRDLIVGTGINAFCDPIDFSFGWDLKAKGERELHRAFDYALESDEKFLRWARDPELCDVKKTQSWFDLQRTALQETATVGSGLLKYVFSPGRPGEVPFRIQSIEFDQLDRSKDRNATSTQTRIVNGIEFDADGYEIGIWLYDGHPHDSTFSFSSTVKSTFVPAANYTHFFKKTRPSQHIGATWIHAIGKPISNREQFRDSELLKAIKQALHVLALKTETPGTLDAMSLTPEDGNQSGNEIALGRDPYAVEIGINDELQMLESPSPAGSQTKDFFNVVDHDVAAGTNLSYYSQTGRFNETNYGGFKGAMNLEDAQMTPIKDEVGLRVVLPVRRTWNRLAVATGEITNVSPARFLREERRLQRFDCIGPGRELLDAEKENDAALGKIRGGFSTLKRECALRGLHWIQVLRQIKLENTIAETLGVTLDHSKGQGGQVKGNTRSAETADGETAASY